MLAFGSVQENCSYTLSDHATEQLSCEHPPVASGDMHADIKELMSKLEQHKILQLCQLKTLGE